PRPRAGGDRREARGEGAEGMFQSTPPRGGRRKVQPYMWRTPTFQSTPPRGGRPIHAGAVVSLDGVSIHAPARGATPRPVCSSRAYIKDATFAHVKVFRQILPNPGEPKCAFARS